jgi:hypothetical protein
VFLDGQKISMERHFSFFLGGGVVVYKLKKSFNETGNFLRLEIIIIIENVMMIAHMYRR